MAPPTRTAKSLKSILKKTTPSTISKQESLFPASKKDKRRIKHEQLINKVTKSAAKTPRRRRPNKKLITTLDALADALPTDDFETGTTVSAGEKPEDQVNIIKRKSMKSRPGAMKRREKLDKGERDRFAKNMAQLAASRPASDPEKEIADVNTVSQASVPSTSDRWAALRGFISHTLETKPELSNLKS